MTRHIVRGLAVLCGATLLATPAPASAQQPDANTTVPPALFQAMRYRMVGPSRGGRVTAVAGVPSEPNVFYMGASGGGVWKTEDYGITWGPISDGYFETGSIGAIRVADSDPSTIYVGTGSDGIRSNVIQGRGVYKSTDAGKTWQFVGLKDVGQIGAVLIHPSNPDVVYIAAQGNAFVPNVDRGVFRTTDGGKTWQKVLFVSDSTGCTDLEFAPDNPKEIYAAMWHGQRKPWTIISGAKEGGIYRSTDGGDTWTKLAGGLPQGLFGNSDLAVSAADPNRVYALIEAPEPQDGLYRSDDRGDTWRQVSSYNPLLNRPFYYTGVEADPTNADVVFVNDEGFYESTDGGAHWERRETPHGDNHDMWINPRNHDIWIQSNDGGANITQDGGKTWSSQLNQPTAELYQVDVDNQFPHWLYAGQQDASSITVPMLPPFPHPAGPQGYWLDVGGCETGPSVPNPDDADIVYSNCKGLFGRYSKRTGQEKQLYIGAQDLYGTAPRDLIYRFQRTSPIAVSPHDSHIVYMGSQYLHETKDEGETWERISPDLTADKPQYQGPSGGPITRDITGEEHYSVIYAIQESRLQAGLIWVGANDGPVHVTRDGGKTWTDVTPKDLPPDGRIQNIEASPHSPGKAYIAAYRYMLGDDKPYIYRTTDYGQSWTLLTTGTNGIPADYPTRVVREDPVREGLLFAGTQYGMFISFDDGAHWQRFQQNLPATPVTDIKVVDTDLAVSTMGRSFWVLDDITPLREVSAELAKAPAHLFQPRDAYRMRYSTRSGFGPQSPDDPEYIPPGALIDYTFGQAPAGPVTLEILDAQGAVIRSFSSEAGRPRLQKTPGMHRFLWDLAYAGPEGGSGRRGGGSLATPGTYQVRLSAAGWSDTESFRVLIDPRVAKDGVTQADLDAQLALSLKVRDATAEAHAALARVRQAEQTAKGAAQTKLEAIDRRLATDTANGIRYPQPMLIDQLGYLYGMITRADQRVGQDGFERYAELRKQLDDILLQVGAIVGK
jgi:photosystem II stability/assembly factor-like uncharacterized protein